MDGGRVKRVGKGEAEGAGGRAEEMPGRFLGITVVDYVGILSYWGMIKERELPQNVTRLWGSREEQSLMA